MEPKLQAELNMLLAHLEDFHVVKLVDDYYRNYDNPAPAQLLRSIMDKLQERLNKSYEKAK